MDLIAAIENQSRAEGIDLGMVRGRAVGRAEGIDLGMAKGRAEGINLGMAKGRAETACNMLHDGVDDAVVMKYTGLTQEQLNALRMRNS